MEGSLDARHDALANAVQAAWFAAYWNNAKHPQSLKRVLAAIYADDNTPKPDVDVDAFLERKKRFMQNGGLQKTNPNS